MRYKLLNSLKILITAIFLLSSLSSASAQLLAGHEFVGKWKRSDGNYELIVESVSHDGTAKVRYLNPKPINVESAKLISKRDVITLTIVLRDTGYPGSTYELIHSPEKNMLVGYYTMPSQDQRFEVSFVPVKKKETTAGDDAEK